MGTRNGKHSHQNKSNDREEQCRPENVENNSDLSNDIVLVQRIEIFLNHDAISFNFNDISLVKDLRYFQHYR